jgi:PTS system nitrogen regulatory IIA component
MRLSDLLPEEAIQPSLAAATGPAVLAELAHLLAPRARISSARLLALLEARERLGSTALGGGVAIPHCRLEGSAPLVACLGMHARGVDFGAADGGRVHLFLGLVGPSAPAATLIQALARGVTLLRDARLRERLQRARDAATVRLCLEAAEDSLASRPR